MKISTPLVAALFLTACASQPSTTSSPAVAAPVAAPAKMAKSAAPSSTDDKVTAEKLVAMQRAGYKIMNRDGQTYYCRVEKKTGSQIARDTVCLTEKEVDNLRDATQRGLAEVTRQLPPPQGK